MASGPARRTILRNWLISSGKGCRITANHDFWEPSLGGISGIKAPKKIENRAYRSLDRANFLTSAKCTCFGTRIVTWR